MSTDQNFNNFVGLSSILTGYSADVIAPPIDNTGLVSEYFTWMMQHADSQAFLQTLSVFQSIAAKFPISEQPQQVEQQILQDPNMGNIARRMLRLWYLATWYTSEPPDPNMGGQVVSMNAYTLGLAWDAAQAHPMGYSEERFGYWAVAPAATDVSPNAFPAVNVPPSPPALGQKAAEVGEAKVALQRGGI